MSYFLASFSRLIRAGADDRLVTQVWSTVNNHLLPEIELLPDDDHFLSSNLGVLLMEMEMQTHRTHPSFEEEILDPFRINIPLYKTETIHRETMLRFMGQTDWVTGIEDGARQIVRHFWGSR